MSRNWKELRYVIPLSRYTFGCAISLFLRYILFGFFLYRKEERENRRELTFMSFWHFAYSRCIRPPAWPPCCHPPTRSRKSDQENNHSVAVAREDEGGEARIPDAILRRRYSKWNTISTNATFELSIERVRAVGYRTSRGAFPRQGKRKTWRFAFPSLESAESIYSLWNTLGDLLSTSHGRRKCHIICDARIACLYSGLTRKSGTLCRACLQYSPRN